MVIFNLCVFKFWIYKINGFIGYFMSKVGVSWEIVYFDNR